MCDIYFRTKTDVTIYRTGTYTNNMKTAQNKFFKNISAFFAKSLILKQKQGFPKK